MKLKSVQENLINEILQIVEKEKVLTQLDCYFTFHNEINGDAQIKDLKKYNNFSTIIRQLMNK